MPVNFKYQPASVDIESVKSALATWASSKPLVARLFIFGSRARGEQRSDSDLDVAVELDLSAAQGMDESGGLATWMFDTSEWEDELRVLIPFKIDLQQYRGIDTPIIHEALARSGQLVYTKAG